MSSNLEGRPAISDRQGALQMRLGAPQNALDCHGQRLLEHRLSDISCRGQCLLERGVSHDLSGCGLLRGAQGQTDVRVTRIRVLPQQPESDNFPNASYPFQKSAIQNTNLLCTASPKHGHNTSPFAALPDKGTKVTVWQAGLRKRVCFAS